MSYILDALKKAAEQRGASGTALLRPPTALARVNRLGRLPWIVVGVLVLLNLAGALYLMRPAPTVTPPPPPVLPRVALIQPIEAPPPPAPTQVIPAEPPRPVEPPRQAEPPRPIAPARPVTPSAGPAVRPVAPAQTSTPAPPGAIGGPALSGTAPARPADKPVVRTTPDARVTIARPDPTPPAAAAPARADTQRFKLEVLSYSDVPAQRLVFINGRRYREGELLDGGGVKVEEIREDSVILSEAGQRFTLR